MVSQSKILKSNSELEKYINDNTAFFARGMQYYPKFSSAMPAEYSKIEEKILIMDVYPDDIWVITYPKCGTTWTQEMAWLIANNLDYDEARSLIEQRFAFLELPGLCVHLLKALGVEPGNLEYMKNMQRPRLFKSHLSVDLLPRQLWTVKPKIIYVMREPKDVAASYLNHYRIINGYVGTKEKFFESFMSGCILYGSYFGNVKSFWSLRSEANVLINTFEEMKKDLPTVIRRTVEFLGKTISESQTEELTKHLQFSTMKDNEFANMKSFVSKSRKGHGVASDHDFMNKGSVGNYREEMSQIWIDKFEEWKRKEKLKYDLNDPEFPY